MAQYEEITIDQGADVSIELHLVEQDGSTKDLFGYTPLGKVKKSYNSDSDYTWDFAANVKDPAADGIVTLSLTNVQTDEMKAGRYVYDVEISFVDSDGDTIIERVLEGIMEVTPSVTR
jgi:hypothetical protein